MITFLCGCLLAYLVGSIPTGYIVGKVFKKVDIRTQGSGNMGATNVFRVIGKRWGIFVLVCDILKGVVATLLLVRVFDYAIFGERMYTQCVYGVCAIIGHNWTLFLRFKGGKGVATTTGVILALFPNALALSFLFFCFIVMITRYISLGSLLGALSFPLFIWLLYGTIEGFPVFLCFSLFLVVFIFIRHKSNIKRLCNGTENKISFSRKKSDS
jgi:acyl phosphate:glycerol-3-phosphate acyltransferase